MSMAMLLEHTRFWLRDKFGWDHTNCGVHEDCYPPVEAASPFYVGIDEAAVETGNEETDSLKESLSIVIGVWKKPEHLPKDLKGLMKLPQDLYVLSSMTLERLQRLIICHKGPSSLLGSSKNGLHKNYEFMNSLNSRYNLPNDDTGDSYKFPLIYKGRGRMEHFGVDTNTGAQVWDGYRLRFSGMSREMKLRSTDAAIG